MTVHRRFYEVIAEWGDTGAEPVEYDYTEAGLRAACDGYHEHRNAGRNPSVWLVFLDEDTKERDETPVLGPRPEGD